MIPTIVALVPPIEMTLPIAFASAPRRLSHNERLMIATGGPPTRSSSPVNGLPFSGQTCKTSNRFAETYIPWIGSGSPSPVKVKFHNGDAAANAVKIGRASRREREKISGEVVI